MPGKVRSSCDTGQSRGPVHSLPQGQGGSAASARISRDPTPCVFIRQLNYLVALAQEQHSGRAAQACNVSQPALSGAIRSIERELGMTIVQRGQRFESFTPDGERVLAVHGCRKAAGSIR
jgi:Bacterial regulatory helix-turn-helix protein, lysR family